MSYQYWLTDLLGAAGWKSWRLRGSGLLAFCLASLSLQAQVTVSASLDRASISMGESATLQVTVQNGSADGSPQLPPTKDLGVAATRTYQQTTIVNFQLSSTQTYNYQLTPVKPGDFIIKPITVIAGGKSYFTSALRLQVTPASQAPPGVPKEAFLKLEVPRPRVYVGEPFPLDIKLYALQGRLIEEPQLPDAGFIIGKVVKHQTHENYQNQSYNELTYRRMATATKPGKTQLGPATMAFAMVDTTRADIFGQFAQKTVTLVSEPITLQVMPLPATNVPSSFAGAIGNFSIRFWAGPTNVAVGDPITVHVQIVGQGSFDSLTLPEQTEWREFKVYPPTSTALAADDLGLSGTNSFEQVVVPQNAEITQLAGFDFSFFNPTAGQYRTVRMPSIPILVRASAATPQPNLSVTNKAASSERPAATEIVHIKPDLGMLAPLAPPLILRGWFIGLQFLAPLAWIALVLRRRNQEKLARNPRLQRRRQVARMIRGTLPDLARMASSGAVESFHATAFRLLQEKLGERLDLPASAITEAVIDERLRHAGAQDSLRARLHELFQMFNQARYAPNSSTAELAGLLSKIESVLTDLERVKG